MIGRRTTKKPADTKPVITQEPAQANAKDTAPKAPETIGTVASNNAVPVNLTVDFTTEEALRNYASEITITIGQSVRMVAAGTVAHIANRYSGMSGKPAEALGDFKKRLADMVHSASGVASRSQRSEYVGVMVTLATKLLKERVLFDIVHASGAKEATDLLVAWCNNNGKATLEALKEFCGYATKAANAKAKKDKVTADKVVDNGINAAMKKVADGKGTVDDVAAQVTSRIPAAVLRKAALDKMTLADAKACLELCEARIAYLEAHPEKDPAIANDRGAPQSQPTQGATTH